ncbi:hypothetical protein MPER_08023, partial [Moniliophthora perniciosa FA553]
LSSSAFHEYRLTVRISRQLEKGNFKTVNVTTTTPTASHPGGVTVTTTFTGKGDPGYLLSPNSLSDLARRGGVLTPAVACGEALIKRLQSNERFDIRAELDDGRNETRKSV